MKDIESKTFHNCNSKREHSHGFSASINLSGACSIGTCSDSKKGLSGSPFIIDRSLKRIRASYTVEASVVLPVFACLCVFALLFFRILTVEWGIETAIREVSKNVALYGEARNIGTSESNEEGGGKLLTTAGIAAASTARIYSLGVPVDYIDLGAFGLDYSDSRITDDDVVINVSYRISLPFSLIGKHTYDVTQVARYRRWVGFNPSKSNEEEEEYVYVAKYGEDYHHNRDCPYLAPSVRGVGYGQLGSLRNKSGGRYHACSLCTKGRSPVMGGVFITDYGTTYHYSNSCSGLKRTVYTMEINEAKSRYRPCPKCGRQ